MWPFSQKNEPPLKLVDCAKLAELITKLDLTAEQREFVAARWLHYVKWWDRQARYAKPRYQCLRAAVIVGSAAIPALVGLRELAPGALAIAIAVTSVLVGTTVAICAGLETLLGYGMIWREKRAAAEMIKCEGFSFFQLCGEYAKYPSHKEAYPIFAESVERQIRSEVKDYIIAVTPPPPSAPSAGSNNTKPTDANGTRE